MADSSFDIVSKLDRQEADNALNQAAKEIANRYDFKNTGAKIEWHGEDGIEITANADERALAILDVFKEKLIKRGISLKALETGDPRQSGKEVKINGTFSEGISSEQAKKVSHALEGDEAFHVSSDVATFHTNQGTRGVPQAYTTVTGA